MNKFICPNCHTQSISVSTKLFMGSNSINQSVCPECNAILKTGYIGNALVFSPMMFYICWNYLQRPDWAPQLTGFSMALSIGILLQIFVNPIKIASQTKH
jgi:hypothetical protein